MKTNNLIRALVADHPTQAESIERRCASALVPALLVVAAVFVLSMGTRADIAVVATDPRFIFKFLVTLGLAMTALMLLCRLARPGAEVSPLALSLAVAPALLAVGVIAELLLIPASSWSTKLIGHNSLLCLMAVPLLSAPLLVAALVAMRHGAPTRPALTGAVAGLVAGGLGAAIYALNCTDDSPLFVAAWYSVAILLVTAVGAMLGTRVLRW
jgi:hypothetical protein